jgi:hypothetical protein
MIIRTLLQVPARKWLQITFGAIITLLGFYIFLTHIGQAKAYYVTILRTMWDSYLRISYSLVVLGIYSILQAAVSSIRLLTSNKTQDITVYGIAATPVFRWLTKISALLVIVFSTLMFSISHVDSLSSDQKLQILILYGMFFYAGHTMTHFSTTPSEQRKRSLIVIVALLWFCFVGLGIVFEVVKCVRGISYTGLRLVDFFYWCSFTLPFVLLSYLVVKEETIARICDTIFLYTLTFFLPLLTFMLAVGAFASNLS